MADPLMAESSTDPRLRETLSLIASDKVEGTPVRRPNGESIGTIERVMIDKRSGKTAYAVMSFGGFLGIGEDYYPVPWDKLTYDEKLDAYVLDISDDQLKTAPKYADEGSYDWSRAEGRRLNDFYGVSYQTAIV